MAAATERLMTLRNYRDIIAWQLARSFREEIATIVRESPLASRQFRYREQILSSAASVSKNIKEGFLRGSPGELAHFLDFSVASLGEAEEWLVDGIEDGYFTAVRCEPALKLARRCFTAMIRLNQSQLREMARRRQLAKTKRR